MSEVGYATLAIIPSFKNFSRELDRGTSGSLTSIGRSGGDKFGAAAGTSAGHRFSNTFGKIAKAGAFAALGGLALGGKILGDSIGAASDLGETMSKTAQIFGKEATPELEKFADKAAGALGQSKQQALDAAATFGIFGKSAGLQGGKLVKFSSNLDSLATDLASFSNTSPEDAINAIGSALRGEAEPIRAYGVLLDEATLKAEALRLGLLKPVKDKGKILKAQVDLIKKQKAYNDVLKKHPKGSFEALSAQADLTYSQGKLQKATQGTIGPLTQQQKVLAAQSSIFRQTKDQQGDFARTSGGLANQQRVLAARFADAKTELGKGLLPVATQVVTYLNTKGVPALEKFSDWFTKKGVPAIKDFSEKATPFVKGVLTDTRDILKDIAPYAKKVADAFNSLPPGIKKGLLAGALIGGAATKLPGGKPALGATSSLVKWVLPKKPILVTVTNPGGLGNGGTDKPVPVAPQSQIAKIASLAAKTVASVAIMHLGDELLKRLADSGKPKGGIDAGKVAKNLKTANSLGGFGDFSIPLVGGTQIHNAVEDLKGVDALLAGLAKGGNSKAAAAQFAAIAREAAKQNVSLKDINAKFPKYLAATRDAKTETGKIGKAFDGPIRRARILNNEVKLIGTNARGSQAELRILLAEIRAAREAPILNAQGVSSARTGKVDNQLGRGGMYVANMNVSGTSLSEVQRDAEHKHRARANGAESFR